MVLKDLFMFKIHATPLRLLSYLLVGLSGILSARTMRASDHLDTPTVIADPAADIGDLFAWTSSDGRRLNLVMDIVAHQFSNNLQYVFHVDSGKAFGKTTKSITILCQFDVRSTVECWAGNVDYVRGNARSPAGLESEKHHFRVFAGLRDDPFFNNVKGTRAAYNVAGAALQNGAQVDSEQCPALDVKTSQEILRTWRSTDGGPARNFLAGWKTSALAVSIDLDVVSTGGRMLAVWGTVHKQIAGGQTTQSTMPKLGEQIERTARPLIKNALVGGPLAPDSISDQRKELIIAPPGRSGAASRAILRGRSVFTMVSTGSAETSGSRNLGQRGATRFCPGFSPMIESGSTVLQANARNFLRWSLPLFAAPEPYRAIVAAGRRTTMRAISSDHC
jgi:hypothetical protein